MKTAKEQVLALIERLPDDVSLESIMAALAFRARVVHGLEQTNRGQVVTHDEAKRRLSRWLT